MQRWRTPTHRGTKVGRCVPGSNLEATTAPGRKQAWYPPKGSAKRILLVHFRQQMHRALKMAKRLTILPEVDLLMRLWNTFVAFGTLVFLVKVKLNLKEYFPTWSDFFRVQNIIVFFENKWGVIILSTLLLSLYYIVFTEAKTLRRVGEKLFSRKNMPVDWRYVKNRKLFTMMVVLMIVIFLSLAWFVDNVSVFCGVFAGIPLLAALKIIKLRESAVYHFDRYQPLDSDPYKPFILERRLVMNDYLNKPQVRAFLLETTALVGASIVALLPHLGIRTFQVAPYLIIGGAVAVHEYFVWRWRSLRNRKLEETDERETEMEVENDKQQAQSAALCK
jgi:hypothetical protein